MEDILGSVVFHRALPMTKGLEHDSLDPWVLQFVGDAFALGGKAASVVSDTYMWRACMEQVTGKSIGKIINELIQQMK